VSRSVGFLLGVKWFETPEASRHHGNRRFPYDPEVSVLVLDELDVDIDDLLSRTRELVSDVEVLCGT
jgi:hypothetical protein